MYPTPTGQDEAGQWSTVSKSYDPLQLYSLFECVVLKQTDDQYPFAAVIEQVIALLMANQGNLTNAQWYECFNTKYEVAKSVGMQFNNIEVLWEYCTALLNDNAGASFASLSVEDQALAMANAEDRLLAYLFIQNSNEKMDSLKRKLQNDYTKGNDQYPKTRSTALMFLDHYSCINPTPAGSEGTAFTQKEKSEKKGKGGGDLDKKKEVDGEQEKKDPCTDMKCFKCNRLGHPACICPNNSSDDNASAALSKSKASLHNLKKSFAQLQSALKGANDDFNSTDGQ